MQPTDALPPPPPTLRAMLTAPGARRMTCRRTCAPLQRWLLNVPIATAPSGRVWRVYGTTSASTGPASS